MDSGVTNHDLSLTDAFKPKAREVQTPRLSYKPLYVTPIEQDEYNASDKQADLHDICAGR